MALKQSMQRVSRETKLNRLGGSMALKIAKQQNDPLVAKVIKFKGLWRKWSEKLMQKYGQKGKMAARKAAMSSMSEAKAAGIPFESWEDLIELVDDPVWTSLETEEITESKKLINDYI